MSSEKASFGKVYIGISSALRGLTKNEMMIFWHLFDNAEYGNMVYAKTNEIAACLEMQETHVRRALRKLREGNLMVKCRRGEYMFNPKVVLIGKDEYRTLAIEYDKHRQREAGK